MPDIIRLLPDSVANQIAAGEVVQRPASAVKELLENAVDSGATSVKLIIKEAGKNLIQVIDNGCGMSERDARMCFERHATSKIQVANDLLAIRTLGFRGEALASIASIAQVEMNTRRLEDEVGTAVIVEGSDFKSQLPCATTAGTSISVKNLFFNVPARRNFLKSNTLEFKYISEEFFRVALVNPHIAFSFYNNDKILHQVPASTLKQRVVALFGNQYNPRLVPVDSNSSIVKISGFIGKPEFARKIRGEQYFFANGRFIKNAYLHHAVEGAFQELIPKDAFPTYFLYMEIEPGMIDVNIHPTKTEINFQDSRSIYAILHSSVRQAIGKFNMTPSLDFEREPSMDLSPLQPGQQVKAPTITINPEYNPFEKKTNPQQEITLTPRERSNQDNWQKLYDPLRNFPPSGTVNQETSQQSFMADMERSSEKSGPHGIFQVQNRFIVTHLLNGIIIIDQQNAHERILYEQLINEKDDRGVSSQKLLIPHSLSIGAADFELLKDHTADFEALGFEISEFGKNTFLVNAVPPEIKNENITGLFESLLETMKEGIFDQKDNFRNRLASSIARNLAVRRGTRLQQEEMDSIVENLFTCRVPEVTIDGKPTMFRVSYDQLQKSFK